MPADRPPGFHTLADLESFAGSRVPPEIWDYIQGGAGEERTLRANRRTFEARTLFPRVLSGVRSVDPTTTILGHRVSAPFFASPTAYQGAIHPDGESGTARACQSAGILGIYSTLASHSIGQVAAAAPKGMRWFQLYLQPDPRVTDRLLTDAERAGCTALVVTVDTPLLGLRDRQSRLGFALRAPVPVGNGPDVLSPAREPTREGERFTVRTEAAATWKVIDELAHATRLPLVVKGILTPSDARRAVAHGARGILVSNHGGRQLDGAPASLDALPGIVEEIGDDAEIYLDGGVRRGADILVALALGARAVGLGRPVLWALAAEGEVGVARYLELLRADLVSALVLSGRADLAAIDRELLGEPPRPRAVRGSGRRPGSRSRPSSPRRSRGHRYGPSRLRPSNSP